MIPIRDNIPSRTTPFVNYAVIVVCSVVFFVQVRDRGGTILIERFGMISVRVLHPNSPVELVERIPIRTNFGIQLREVRREAAPSAVAPWPPGPLADNADMHLAARRMDAHHR